MHNSRYFFYIVISSFIFCVETIRCSHVSYPLGYRVEFNSELQTAQIVRFDAPLETVDYDSSNTILRYRNLGFTQNGGLLLYDNERLLSTALYIPGYLVVCDHISSRVYVENLHIPVSQTFYQQPNDPNNRLDYFRLTLNPN